MDEFYELPSNDPLTALLKSRGIYRWNELLDIIRAIPYGRNSNGRNLELVFLENRGTCSTKHSLIKRVADLNGLNGISLILGIYKMSQLNTPGIGHTLSNNGLSYIPEAHCYIKSNGRRYDYTNPSQDIHLIEKDIIIEVEIEFDAIIEFKANYHKQFIRKWLINENVNYSFEKIWSIREECIKQLESSQ